MELAATALLYGLGAMLLAAHARNAGDLGRVAFGYVAGLVVMLPLPGLARPPLLQILPAQGALLVGLGMGVLLLRRTTRPGGLPVFGGLLGAAWSSLLLAMWPAPLAFSLPIAAVLAAGLMQLRVADFCPPSLRQDGALLMTVLGLALGLLPEMRAGWESAAVLQGGDETTQLQQTWARGALLVSAASIGLGLIYKGWRYR